MWCAILIGVLMLRICVVIVFGCVCVGRVFGKCVCVCVGLELCVCVCVVLYVFVFCVGVDCLCVWCLIGFVMLCCVLCCLLYSV